MQLYHGVPKTMEGTILYPLNDLRERYPAIYEFEAPKYEGREHLMRQRIPPLGNCLWNDVLFLTAVHPAVVQKEYEAIGYRLRNPLRAFAFDASVFDPELIAVMPIMEMNRGDTYERFDQAKESFYSTIPQATFDYWRDEYAHGIVRPLLYMHIPHILYRGPLDTTLATIVGT